MILEIKKTTEIKLDSLEDLQEYKKSMDDNNLKINIAWQSNCFQVAYRSIAYRATLLKQAKVVPCCPRRLVLDNFCPIINNHK